MKPLLIALSLLLCVTAAATAQQKPERGEAVKAKPGQIVGVVLDEQGEPLPGVLVDVWTWYEGNETKTDSDGSFQIKPQDDDHRKVEVRFSKKGYSPHYIIQQETGGDALRITLDSKTYIEGTITDAEGTPVPGAEVVAAQGSMRGDGVLISDVRTTALSDAGGQYRMHVFPHTYDLRVAVPGTGVARVTGVEVGKDRSVQLDLRLAEGVRFQANVIDAVSGDPVPGLLLWSWKDKAVFGKSDADGKVVITDMLTGEYSFNVGFGEAIKQRGLTFYGHGPMGRWWSPQAKRTWQRKAGGGGAFQRNFDDLTYDLSVGMKPVTIEVERGVVFSGKVYDPNGKPVAGATVAPAKTGSGNSLTGDTRYSTTTKEDGSYRVVMPAGNDFEYNLMVHDGDYMQWRHWANGVTKPFASKPNQQFPNFDLKLSHPATVKGKVTADGDEPVGDLQVRAHAADLRGNRYYDPTTRTKADGSFELKFIRPGKHFIQVEPFWIAAADAPGPSTEVVQLKAGETKQNVQLRVISRR